MRTLTEAAEAAKKIRVELKNKFPKTKFSVKSENYSNGNSINISWTDGVTEKQVEEITTRSDIPQVKYLFLNRRNSPEVMTEIAKEILKSWGVEYKEEYVKTNDYDGTGCYNIEIDEAITKRCYKKLRETAF